MSRFHAMPKGRGGYYGVWDNFEERWHVDPLLSPSEAFDLEEKLNRSIRGQWPGRFSAEIGAARKKKGGSFKAEVIADASGEWVGNALRFPTKEKAEEYARDLAMRWTAVREWRVVPSDDPVMYYEGGKQIGPELGISERRPRYMTAAQEKAEDKKIDYPLADNFSQGQKVIVDKAWKRHWTFKEAPAPTKYLWSKLFTEVGVVSGIDDYGNVYVMDRYDQVHGREGFPVPARFVKAVGPETN